MSDQATSVHIGEVYSTKLHCHVCGTTKGTLRSFVVQRSGKHETASAAYVICDECLPTVLHEGIMAAIGDGQ